MHARLFACVLFLAASCFAQNRYAELKFTVVREEGGKPIRNASVVLHLFDKDGRPEKGGLQLKTDSEGQAEFRGAPFGKLRVQTIARGFQTQGQDYDIDDPVEEIVIQMKKPREQFSIYEDKDDKKE